MLRSKSKVRAAYSTTDGYIACRRSGDALRHRKRTLPHDDLTHAQEYTYSFCSPRITLNQTSVPVSVRGGLNSYGNTQQRYKKCRKCRQRSTTFDTPN